MPVAADMYYYAYKGDDGARPALVLIHGAGGTHLYWPSDVRRIPGYRILAPDLPGHGKSGGRGLQTIDGYVAAVLAWMQAIDLHRAVFVGHSMGSAIALRLAIEHREHVLALGLLGAGARLRVDPEILRYTASETTFEGAVDLIVGSAFSQHAPERLVALARERMAETRPSVLHGDYFACDAFDEMTRISTITQPTIVIGGADDRLTPPRYAQFLADEIPKAELHLLPDAGHMVMLEKPGEVARLLNLFMDGMPGLI
jgi:pimeloyl-ACP methyl ester carboxylesterase